MSNYQHTPEEKRIRGALGNMPFGIAAVRRLFGIAP